MTDAPLPPVASFWTGAPLSFVERLCLKSFVDVGHEITLYSYEKIEGVPEGVKLANAADILPQPDTYTVHPRTGSPAPFADRFRYHLLRKRPGVIWADTDAYCLRPFTPKNGYYFSWEDDHQGSVSNGVLALPADSPALAELIAYTSDEYALLPWLPAKMLDEACRRTRDGDPMHVTEMPWAVWGPTAITHILRTTGEISHALERDVLYPVRYSDRRRFFRKARMAWEHITEDTQSIHLYGRRIRSRLAADYDGIPPRGTLLATLGERHGIAA